MVSRFENLLEFDFFFSNFFFFLCILTKPYTINLTRYLQCEKRYKNTLKLVGLFKFSCLYFYLFLIGLELTKYMKVGEKFNYLPHKKLWEGFGAWLVLMFLPTVAFIICCKMINYILLTFFLEKNFY